MKTSPTCAQYLAEMAARVRLCECGEPLRPLDLTHCARHATGSAFVLGVDGAVYRREAS